MQRQPKRRNGVALGVLGIMLLGFFSITFMAGRPGYWQTINEVVHHPMHAFDPHPVGVVRPGTISEIVVPDPKHSIAETGKGINAKPATTILDATSTTTESGGNVQQSTDTKPAVVAEVKPVETAKPVETVPVETKLTETTTLPAVKAAVNEDETITDLDKDYTPTREMVQKYAQDGYLVVTWANWHYFDFVRTWVAHAREVGITGYIVGAMDDHLLREMIKLKYNCFSMKSGLTLGDFGWGSKIFAKMGREKIRLISIFLKLDVHVVIADVDVTWLRNPIPYFKQYPTADVLTSSDGLANTVSDESLERWPHAAAAANIGIMLFREKSLPFVEHWIEVIEKDETVWDQNAFNDLFRQGSSVIENEPQNLFLGYNGKIRMGILPVSIFCSGHTFHVQRMGHRLGLEPYAVHATFQFSGTPGKRHRMREFMLMDDPPEYFDHSVGFISFTMDGIEPLKPDSGPNTGKMDLANVQGHFKLVNHQIQRIRNAMAIASALGRAVVMPPLWCGQDRWWAPHAGHIPGSNFELPFICPLDHVFDLEGGIFRDLPADTFGPKTEIREYSFFENPRLQPAVRDSKVVVEICAGDDASCSDGSSPAPVQEVAGVSTVRLRSGLSSGAITSALSAVAGRKVIHFNTMNNAFGNFTQASDWVKFRERLKLYGSIWCCIHAHPGHIHYDPWFDQPNHVDKFQREWTTWEPKTGP